MFSFVSSVFSQFLAAPALEQLGFILSLAGLSTFFGATLTLLGLRNRRALIDQLRRDAAALAVERDRAERRATDEGKKVELWDPGAWIRRAEAERAGGNEELAVRVLEEGFERVRLPFADAGLAIAGYHLSMVVGSDPIEHLTLGERFARISSLLAPENSDAAFLLEDAELTRLDGQLDAISELPASFVPANQEDIIMLISLINDQAQKLLDKGRFRLSLRLFRRSLLLISRANVLKEDLSYSVRYKSAQCLFLAGKYEQAWTLAIELLEDQRAAFKENDERLLRTRELMADILNYDKDHEEAYELLSNAITAYEVGLPSDHPNLLLARCHLAAILPFVGQAEQALVLCEDLVPRLVEVFGPENRTTLITLGHQAYSLAVLEKYDDALSLIEEILPLQRKIMGEEHPFVLVARQKQADILFLMGQHERALGELEGVMADMERVLGVDHPHFNVTRRMRERMLASNYPPHRPD